MVFTGTDNIALPLKGDNTSTVVDNNDKSTSGMVKVVTCSYTARGSIVVVFDSMLYVVVNVVGCCDGYVSIMNLTCPVICFVVISIVNDGVSMFAAVCCT